ncbi:hypothetical protein IFM89_009499, partial [Coptis chinensis]
SFTAYYILATNNELICWSELQITSADATKNELLRAMDFRLAALRDELVGAFNQVSDGTFSYNQITDLVSSPQFFEAVDLRNSLSKYLELSHKNQDAYPHNVETKFSQGLGNENRKLNEGTAQGYYTNLKSLSFIPAIKRISSNEDPAEYSIDEGSARPFKKPVSNASIMSVKDAISLFEKKQSDQRPDLQKKRFPADNNVSTNKSVLRRWSAVGGEIQNTPVKVKQDCDSTGESTNVAKTADESASLTTGEEKSSYSTGNLSDSGSAQAVDTTNRVTVSADWTQQKEDELNLMMMKMMESKPGILDQRKVEVASKKVGIAGKQDSIGRPKKPQKNPSPPLQPKKESSRNSSPLMQPKKDISRPAAPKKSSPKASPLPATRNQTVERSQLKHKGDKGTTTETKLVSKGVEGKKQRVVGRSGDVSEAKALHASGDSPAKPSFYNKVTKKGSVVPLETKPFLRKKSGTVLGAIPVKTKVSQIDESLNCENLIQPEEAVTETSEPVSQKQERDSVSPIDNVTNLEAEDPVISNQKKSKGEADATGWSSPSVFSDGEEDAEEPKASSKRHADAILRKSSHQAKGFGHLKASLGASCDGGNSSKNTDSTAVQDLHSGASGELEVNGRTAGAFENHHFIKLAANYLTKLRARINVRCNEEEWVVNKVEVEGNALNVEIRGGGVWKWREKAIGRRNEVNPLFKNWGGKDPHRTAEDVKYAVARFFQCGGTFQNYYMVVHYIATSYDYDAPLDEYGNLNQPKWGHLKELHLLLKSMEKVLAYGELSTQIFNSNVNNEGVE